MYPRSVTILKDEKASLEQKLEAAKHTDLAEINQQVDVNKHEYTPLSFAIKKKENEVAKLLIERKANIELKSYIEADTPLMTAIKVGNDEMANVLIEAKADVNVLNDYRCSPLTYAANRNRMEAAKLLIKANADINHHIPPNNNPLYLAASNNFKDLVEILLAQPKIKHISRALCQACEWGHKEVAKLLIAKLLLENNQKKIEKGLSEALSKACAYGHKELADLLIKNGANIQDGDEQVLSSILLNSFSISMIGFILHKGWGGYDPQLLSWLFDKLVKESERSDSNNTMLIEAFRELKKYLENLIHRPKNDLIKENKSKFIEIYDKFNQFAPRFKIRDTLLDSTPLPAVLVDMVSDYEFELPKKQPQQKQPQPVFFPPKVEEKKPHSEEGFFARWFGKK